MTDTYGDDTPVKVTLAPEPRLELLETCWRVTAPSGSSKVLACGVYRTDVGLELRAGYRFAGAASLTGLFAGVVG